MIQNSYAKSKIIGEIFHLLTYKYKEISDQEETFRFPKLFWETRLVSFCIFFFFLMKIVVTKNLAHYNNKLAS